MKPLTKASLAGLGSLVMLASLTSGEAVAQYQSRTGTPPPRSTPVSPYIGLAGRTGGAAAFDYYRRIQPELQWRGAVNNLQQQLQVTQSAVTGLEQSSAAALPGTGHATYFMNLGGYFQSSGAGASPATAARPQTAAGQAPQRAGAGRSGTINAASGGRSGR